MLEKWLQVFGSKYSTLFFAPEVMGVGGVAIDSHWGYVLRRGVCREYVWHNEGRGFALEVFFASRRSFIALLISVNLCKFWYSVWFFTDFCWLWLILCFFVELFRFSPRPGSLALLAWILLQEDRLQGWFMKRANCKCCSRLAIRSEVRQNWLPEGYLAPESHRSGK